MPYSVSHTLTLSPPNSFTFQTKDLVHLNILI